MTLQAIEYRALSGQSAFLSEPIERSPQQSRSPFAVVNAVGAPNFFEGAGCFQLLQDSIANRNMDRVSTALLRVIMIVSVGHKMLQGPEKERTETTFGRPSARIGASLNQVGEESLSEILSIMRGVTLPTQE